jgi:hypothetical protein
MALNAVFYGNSPETAFDSSPAAGTAAFRQRIAAIPESKCTAQRYQRVTPDDSLAPWPTPIT